MKYLLTTLLLGAWVQLSWAQLKDSDTLRWGYRLTAQSSLSTGNVDRWLVLGGAEALGVGRVVGFKSSNDYRYGTFGARVTENDWSSRNFVYLHPRRRLYPYAMGLIEGLERRAIELRYQLGVGVTYVVLRQAKHVIRVSATPVFEASHYRRAQFNREALTDDERWNSWRLTARMAGQHQFTAGVRLSYELWAQPSLSRGADTRALSDVSLTWAFGKRLALRTTHQLSYDQIVQVGYKSLDSFWLIGLQWGNQ